MIRLEGVGLHGGLGCAVTLARKEGPTSFSAQAARATLPELCLARADHGVGVTLGARGPTVDLVEHLLAAIGGLRLWNGVAIAVEGGEIPLLDGGARGFAEALLALDVAPSEPCLVVARPFSIDLDGSTYQLAPADTVDVSVTIAFDHPSIGTRSAAWHGGRDDFVGRVAPARTFGFARDHGALLAAGRARGVDLASVVVYGDGDDAPSPPRDGDEPARHKLLDLIGDLTLFGGPPLGIVRATRPGHARTHRALRAALDAGALVKHGGAPWFAVPSLPSPPCSSPRRRTRRISTSVAATRSIRRRSPTLPRRRRFPISRIGRCGSASSRTSRRSSRTRARTALSHARSAISRASRPSSPSRASAGTWASRPRRRTANHPAAIRVASSSDIPRSGRARSGLRAPASRTAGGFRWSSPSSIAPRIRPPPPSPRACASCVHGTSRRSPTIPSPPCRSSTRA